MKTNVTDLNNKNKIKKEVRGGYKLYKVFVFLSFLFLTILFCFPYYWIITGSFKDQQVAIQIPPEWFPLKPTLMNWKQLFSNPSYPVYRWTFNSFFISFSTMILMCATSSLAGYALAKKRFYGKKIIFSILMFSMALPKQVILIPLLQLLVQFRMIDTYSALILPAIGWPFGVFLMKQFSETLPGELLEAAKIDGATELQVFTKVVFPLIKPGVGALAIFTFISAWNDYFSQLLFTRTMNMKSLPLGVAGISQVQEFATNYGLLMAGAALASIPMFIVFISLQKYFTQGITMGAVKG